MSDASRKEYIFASDFDQTLTFNDSGYVLAELVGIPTAEFERKATGMARLNLVQQGGELAYLLLPNPKSKPKARKNHLSKVEKPTPRKKNSALLYKIPAGATPGFLSVFYSPPPPPVKASPPPPGATPPPDHISGTEFLYTAS